MKVLDETLRAEYQTLEIAENGAWRQFKKTLTPYIYMGVACLCLPYAAREVTDILTNIDPSLLALGSNILTAVGAITVGYNARIAVEPQVVELSVLKDQKLNIENIARSILEESSASINSDTTTHTS